MRNVTHPRDVGAHVDANGRRKAGTAATNRSAAVASCIGLCIFEEELCVQGVLEVGLGLQSESIAVGAGNT